MGLLDESLWSGMVYSDGWREANGGVRDVIEPATGAKLGTVGIANASDVTVSTTVEGNSFSDPLTPCSFSDRVNCSSRR